MTRLALIDIKQLISVAAGGNKAKTGKEMRDIGIIPNGAVLIEDDRIVWVGKMENLSMADLKETDVVDCMNKIVMPGFVDSHTHAVFGGSREEEFAMRAQGATYQEIAARGGGILNTVRSTRAASKKELKKSTRRWLAGMMRHGTTTVEMKSGYGLEKNNEIKLLEVINELKHEEVMTVVPTFLGAHAVGPEFQGRTSEYIDEVINAMLPYVVSHSLASFCDVFCEQGYFSPGETEKILTKASSMGLKVKVHADELSSSGGAEISARCNAISADHLEHISDDGIRALAEKKTVATLLPGVSFFLNHQYAPARKLIDGDVPVAIATDFNPGSCMSYSMPLMMTMGCAQMKMTPEEVICAATLNGAAALNLSHEIGSIEIQKKADLVILDIPDYRFLPYHFGENHIYRVIKSGVVLEF